MKPPANVIAIAQAKYFIKALLDEFHRFQALVKDASIFAQPLVLHLNNHRFLL